MYLDKKSILVFGGSDYQLSLVKECRSLGLFTVVIDPNPEAIAQDYCDVFEIIGGQDYMSTCRIIEKYNIDSVITAATDKPLVMMARVAQKYGLPFFSEETARITTDKFLMKERFIENNLPCAKGKLVSSIPSDFNYPLVIKPRDNSGSRGVIFCHSKDEAELVLEESKSHTRSDVVVAEEVIEGTEYSIESLHYNGKSKIVQITEKIVTPLPYFIELGHIQPPVLSDSILEQIEELVKRVAEVFNFENCGTHNEVKIKNGEITLIEVSPRIGGDFISSILVEESTGINMERALIQISLGEDPDFSTLKPAASGIFFFHFKEGKVKAITPIDPVMKKHGVIKHQFDLEVGSVVPIIRVGTDRYGYFIIRAKNRVELLKKRDEIFSEIEVVVVN